MYASGSVERRWLQCCVCDVLISMASISVCVTTCGLSEGKVTVSGERIRERFRRMVAECQMCGRTLTYYNIQRHQ